MKVKVKTKSQKKSKLSFPKLMISDNTVRGGYSLVVLFASERCGTVIHPGTENFYEPGHYSASWNPSVFKDFEGTVKMKNSKR